MKTYTYKRFKYQDKFYKFKEPLKVQINNFLCYDLKTMAGELSIPSIQDGYTKKEEITNPEKEIKWYLQYIFESYYHKLYLHEHHFLKIYPYISLSILIIIL